MHVQVTNARLTAKTGRVRFLALSRPEWRLLLALLLLAVGGALLLLASERTRLSSELAEEEAVPAFALLRPGTAAAPGPASLEDAAGGSSSPGVAAPLLQPAQPVQAGAIVTVTPAGAHPLEAFRLERERLRSRQAEILQSILADPSASEDRRHDAQERLMALWAAEEAEAQIEGLLAAQGFDAVVVVSGGGAHVVVDGVLDAGQAERIGELTARLAGVRREAVSIVDAASGGR